MKTTERFSTALKALIIAFFDETLEKGNCAACAVGNMVAGAYGKKANLEAVACGAGLNTDWKALFMSDLDGQIIRPWQYSSIVSRALMLIEKTGYSEMELARVELAFESSTKILGRFYSSVTRDEIMQDQFNGLIAVVDILCEIEGYDSADYKKLFEYTPEFQPVNAM